MGSPLKSRTLFFALCIFYYKSVQSQDKLFSYIDNSHDFQSIAIENYNNSDSILFYIGFDRSDGGLIKTYWWQDNYTLKEVNSFSLPKEFYHPNDIQIVNDALLVTGWNNNQQSFIGWFEKKTGEPIQIISDKINDKNQRLQFSYYHNDILYRGLYDDSRVELQYHQDSEFVTLIKNLKPQHFTYLKKPIQGSEVIGNELAILASFPSRVDLYKINDDYKYDCSFFGEYSPNSKSTEPEGIGSVKYKNDTFIFFGLRYPNRINYINISEFREHCKCYRYSIGNSPHDLDLVIEPFSTIISNNSSLSFSVLSENYLSIQIMSLASYTVEVLYEGQINKGHYTIPIENPHRYNGIYILKVGTKNSSHVQKLLFLSK